MQQIKDDYDDLVDYIALPVDYMRGGWCHGKKEMGEGRSGMGDGDSIIHPLDWFNGFTVHNIIKNMKKIIAFIIAALSLVGCSVQKSSSVVPGPHEITEYRPYPEMSRFGVNGVVYVITLDREMDKTDGNVKYKMSYRQIIDIYCSNVPDSNDIKKPRI